MLWPILLLCTDYTALAPIRKTKKAPGGPKARPGAIPCGDLAPDEDGPAAAVEPGVVESPVVELVMLEPALMVLELGVVAAEEPPVVTKDMGLVVPELPEPLLLEAMGGRTVPVGVDKSGCGRRTRQGKHQPDQEGPYPYRMSQSAAFHRPLSSCFIAQPVILETSFDRSSIETIPAPPVFQAPSGARHTPCNINRLEA